MKTKQVSEFKEKMMNSRRFFNNDWDSAKLSDVCEVITDGSHFSPKEDSQGTMIIATVKDMLYDEFDFNKCKKISKKSFEKLVKNGCSPKNQDILISKDGANCLDLIFVYDSMREIVLLSSIAIVRILKKYNPWFFRYFLLAPDTQKIMKEGFVSGSAIPRVILKDFKNVPIKIPPIEVQTKISKVLRNLDKKIKHLQNQNKILEKIAQTIFKSWFVDFDGVTQFDDSELGFIPKKWNVVKMPELIEINPLRKLKKNVIAPYLGMTDIPTHSSRISRFYLREFTSGMKFMNGDTLVARITPSLENGKTAFVDFLQNDEIGWGSTEYIVLRPQNPIPPEYGYCFARTDEFRSHAIMNMTGTSGRQRVPENCFDDYKVVKPPTEITQTFGKISRKLFLKIKENAESYDILITLRDMLLPKLMSGEIRVHTRVT